MSISPRTRQIVWSKAGATCSFVGCKKDLVHEGDPAVVLVGEMAHIVAREKDGPRGSEQIPGGDPDGNANLILLCTEHHTIVDAQPATYPVARLVQIKADHETWVQEALNRQRRFVSAIQPAADRKELIVSTLLPVTRMPRTVYSAPCTLEERAVARAFVHPDNSPAMYPFIIREGRLLTFCNLGETDNPFSDLVDEADIETHEALQWWGDPNRLLWFMTLLNRSLNKLTGRKGLNLDKEHHRYYFELEEGGRNRKVAYQSLQGRQSKRLAAWRPRFRRTREEKRYCEHLAVRLRFHQVATGSWCLAIRPERRFTRDGIHPLTPRAIGRRSTSRKARMYNIDILEEVHFWRDFLSDGSPRILFKFGSQNLVVETEMISSEITWPGVSGDMKLKDVVRYEDDLFTYAELQAALEMEAEAQDELRGV